MKNYEYRRIYLREGNKWIFDIEYKTFKEIYGPLTNEIIAKKINNCKWIKSIRRKPLYNGYQEITVIYDNNVKAIYKIKEH